MFALGHTPSALSCWLRGAIQCVRNTQDGSEPELNERKVPAVQPVGKLYQTPLKGSQMRRQAHKRCCVNLSHRVHHPLKQRHERVNIARDLPTQILPT